MSISLLQLLILFILFTVIIYLVWYVIATVSSEFPFYEKWNKKKQLKLTPFEHIEPAITEPAKPKAKNRMLRVQ
jgi:hypothetical protein